MPLTKLQFRPGVDRDMTDYSNEGGWWQCDKVRFRSGYPEKIGGWIKSSELPFIGVCRQMSNWITTFGDDLLALGTHQKVYIETGGYYNDITPLRLIDPTLSTTDTDNCVYTSDGSTTVTITLATNHDAATGDFVTISGVTGTVGGIPNTEINANHQITVLSGTSFSFTVDTEATSTVSGGGGTAIDIDFELSPGYAITTAGYGWGVGTWGRDAWGLGTTAEPIYLQQRDWWLDNFDNDLVFNYRNGTPYYWTRGSTVDPGTALTTRAISLAAKATADGYDPNDVPVKVMQLLVSQQDKHLLAFGAVPYGSTDPDDFDPLLIRWADQDNSAQWEPLVTNSAGFLRVSRGSRILRAMPSRQEILIWTDSNLYTLQFLGTTDVFGLQEYADNISVASPRCMTNASNVTFWMGQDKFYAYTGRVETLPCTLRDHVFQNLNRIQIDQVVCGTNEQWSEIWWFYPTEDSDYNNAYVIYNYKDQVWYYGNIDRTAWLDTPLREYPQAANSPVTTTEDNGVIVGSGYLYSHENGVDADGEAMVSYIQSSDFDIGDGEQFMLSRRIIPDITFRNSEVDSPEVSMQIRARNFPGSSLSDNNTDAKLVAETSVGQYTDQIFVRARARQMAFKIQSENLGVQWRLGSPRLDARPDGRR